jgi:hypothetical protein
MDEQKHRWLDESSGNEGASVHGVDVERVEQRRDLLLRRGVVAAVEEREPLLSDAGAARRQDLGERRPTCNNRSPLRELRDLLAAGRRSAQGKAGQIRLERIDDAPENLAAKRARRVDGAADTLPPDGQDDDVAEANRVGR